MKYIKKFNESVHSNIDEISLENLKKKYPNAIITMNSLSKFPGKFFARLDIKTQNGEKKYLGAIKGPVSEKEALNFFNNTLQKNYDKFY